MTEDYFEKQKRKTILIKRCFYAFILGGILVLILGFAFEWVLKAITGASAACFFNAFLIYLTYRRRIKSLHQGIDPSKIITNE